MENRQLESLENLAKGLLATCKGTQQNMKTYYLKEYLEGQEAAYKTMISYIQELKNQ